MRTYYEHLQQRLKTRYNIDLTFDVYAGWKAQIKNKSKVVTNITDKTITINQNGDIYQVWYGHIPVFIVYRHGDIVTALPPNETQRLLYARKRKQLNIVKKERDPQRLEELKAEWLKRRDDD